MTDKQNFEKDINVPSKRLDRIDKMEIDLANYEQMERDIEKIIEPYQLDWELDCLSLPIAIQSILYRKEQECEELRNFHINLVGVKECEIKELLKLKQTLAEIKEIAEKGHKERGNLMRTWWFKDILQRISECEVENE